MPTTLTNGIQLPDKGSVDWYNSMQSNYNLIDTHLGDTDVHVTAEDKANWNSKQGSLSQAQLDAIAQVATNTNDIATLQSGKANASHTHSSSDITDIGDYATKQYVDNSISGLVDNAPDALNTLNELSAALNDDSNFASTVATALGAKADSADLATVATSGSYNDLTDTPTIPTNTSDLTNDSNFVVSSDLATVATSGDYDDLSNKPSIPTNTSDLNNDSGFVTLNDFDIPAKTSDLTNDSGFITSSDVPTSTSDLINDSNFVDTSNSAVASGITSAKVTSYDNHIADTDIHVTTADKSKWNNGVSQSYVLRYSSSSVTNNSTIAYSTLDNTDNIKASDKIIDSDGKIFSIVSVDTTNQTVTVGTALIDLALDGNVVHTNRNDDVSIPLNSTSAELGVTGGYTDVTFLDKNNKKLSGLTLGNYASSKLSYVRLSIFDKDADNNEIQDTLEYSYVSNNNNAYLRVYRDNFCTLGSSSYRWKGIYATNYYYGSDNVEFSTKFVTTDTNQTISGNKTFSSDLSISNTDTTANTPSLRFRNYKVARGSTVEVGGQILAFLDKGGLSLGSVESRVLADGGTALRLYSFNKDSGNQTIGSSIDLRKYSDGSVYLIPDLDNDIWLGNTSKKWKGIFTNQINGLTPSSLGMPSDTYVDISGYVTDLTGGNNQYQAPDNGWVHVDSNTTISSVIINNSRGYSSGFIFSSQLGRQRNTLPVCKGDSILINVNCTSLNTVRFIPCQGNV